MRLHKNDPCPDCNEPVVLRRICNAYTLFRRRHFLMCPACNFQAVARRATKSSNSRYLVLAQEARVSARRYQGKEHASLIGIAESWEKQAREAGDLLASVLTAEVTRGSSSHRVLGHDLPHFVMRNLLAMLRLFRGSIGTEFQKSLVFVFVFLLAGILPTQFAVEAASDAVKASEADSTAVTPSEAAIRTIGLGYRSAGITPHAEAIADVRPMTLTSLMPVLLQDVRIDDSNSYEQEPRNRFGEGVYVQRDGDKLNVDIRGDVLFPRDSATLRPRARALISSIAAELKQYSFSGVDVNSFTDTSGAFEHNQLLSEDRANAVADELARNGIDQERIRAQGFGETHLVVPTPDGVRERRNRRVAIVLAP